MHGFFGGAELHEDAGESLREAVMDLLADPVALSKNGGVLGGHAELLEADAQRDLVRDSKRELGVFRAQRFVPHEHQADAAHGLLANDHGQ